MKKILALMMSLLMICGLAACGEQQTDTDLTPYEVVEIASDKLNEADGVAYGMDMTMTVASSESEEMYSMDMSGDIAMQKIGENDYKLAYHVDTDMSALMGEDTTMAIDMYYADGYMYYTMSDMGLKYKVAMDMTDAMEAVNSPDFSDIEEGMVKEQAIKSDGTGQIVALTLDGSKMTDMVKELSSEFATMSDDNPMNIADIPYTVYLDGEGNITDIETVMTFDIGSGDEAMSITMDMKMSVEQVGNVTVELPDDLDSFMDLTDMMYSAEDDAA